MTLSQLPWAVHLDNGCEYGSRKNLIGSGHASKVIIIGSGLALIIHAIL